MPLREFGAIAYGSVYMKRQGGFTLVEIASTLVIAGMLLGSILRGQEIIVAARVRNLAAGLDGTRIAYFGFHDRYRAAPGDMNTADANAHIPGAPGGCTGGSGCGNRRIDADEVYVAWAQLSRAGFVSGAYAGLISDAAPTAANSPGNPFGGFLQLVHDAKYDDVANPAQPAVLNIKSGGLIPARVIAELDRKIDDGRPLTGRFRSTGMVAGTAYFGSVNCVSGAGVAAAWGAPEIDLHNCGGAFLSD